MKRLQPPFTVNEREALRYLGVPTDKALPETLALLETARGLLETAATPRAVWTPCPPDALGDTIGSDLERHLAGCTGMVLLAATLGAQTDRLLHRLAGTDLALAAAADAAANAAIEAVCDATEADIRAFYQEKGQFTTGRYSPGYGNCPLTLQGRVCHLLDTSRQIGLSPTQENLLIPRKSVTAVLGVADTAVTGHLAGCGHCLLRTTCTYRKRGTTCATD